MEIFGRLHPLLLHLPIGFLILAFAMEWWNRKKKETNFQAAIGFALKLGMWTAILSALSGFLLSRNGDYSENLLFWHQWLGILTAVLSIIIYGLFQKRESNTSFQKLYFPTFSITIFVLLVTGHLGGSLTHGSDFLTAPFHAKEDTAIADLNNANVFESFIQPIFKKKCNSCHNESKLKGKLLLSTIEGIKKGGKTGALFVAGDIKESLMLQRIHLPEDEKKHMPPEGKKQLTEEEIQLLEWWVKQGGAFDKTVAQSEVPENVQTILNKYAEPEDQGVFALDVSAASESKINELRDAGFKVYPVAQESPFLDISWKGTDTLNRQILKKLKKVSKQVIWLDLSNSNLNNGLFSVIGDLPNLQKLFVQKTQITGAALKNLKNHNFLEYLNVYNTNVDDAGIEAIFNLKRLKKLFVWQTEVSDELVSKIQSERPKLDINTGRANSIFGDAQLNPPRIIADKNIFKDSLTVELEISFKGVDIHYTLDGSTPDSTSALYDTTLLLTKTTDLKTFARKEGWNSSEVVGQLFVQARNQPKSIRLNKQPAEKYAAKGANSLIDFKKGTEVFTDGNWLGYQGTHFTATIDLGEQKEVSRVTVGALSAPNSWIFFPKGIEVSLSSNGKNYASIKSKDYPTPKESTPTELKNFSESFAPTSTRYVRIKVKSNLKNPAWHPNPGEPCWVFVDEILVE